MTEPSRPDAVSGMQFPPPPTDPAQAQVHALMQAAISCGAPRFYANAIAMELTPSDMVLTVVWNGVVVAVINLSLPTAKGVGEDLLNGVIEYERLSGQTIQTTGQIAATMQHPRDTPPVSPREPGE